MALRLTTLAAFRSHAGLPADDDDDARVEAILAAVEEQCLKWTGRYAVPGHHFLERVAAIEYYDGRGHDLLVLNRRPVVNVADVRVDVAGGGPYRSDGFPDSTRWGIGVDFVPTSLEEHESNGGTLQALRCYWPRGRQNIRVEYTAGYQAVPVDFVLAVHQVATVALRIADDGMPLESETIGRYAYTVLAGDRVRGTGLEIASSLSILNSYRG